MGDSASCAEWGYVRAQIDPGEGAFDAGAYSFFGDMAPLAEGLGGALEDGLEAPPEEFPSVGGALEDEEDLPIEALMDEELEEEEDLSLAALLRRRMVEKEAGFEDGGGSSSAMYGAKQQVAAPNGLSHAAADAHRHDQPLMPPMPPQPQMLSHLGHQPLQQAGEAPQQGHLQAPAAMPAAAAGPAVPDAVGRPASAPTPAAPSSIMTAEQLEALMLKSAEQPAAAAAADNRGGQLLSLLKGAAANQQQQRQPASPYSQPGAATAGVPAVQQQQLQQQLSLGRTGSTPQQPPQQPGLQMPPAMLPGQQPAPGMLPLPPGHQLPPPEAMAYMQQQPRPQQPPYLGPLPSHQQQQQQALLQQHPGALGPGGHPQPPRMPHPGMAGMPPAPQMGLHPGQLGLPPPMGPQHPHTLQHMQPPPGHPGHAGLPMAPPGGPFGAGPMGPPPHPHALAQQQQMQPGMLPRMPAGQQECVHGPPHGPMPLPGQLVPPGGVPPPFPPGAPPPPHLSNQAQQPPPGFKQLGLPSQGAYAGMPQPDAAGAAAAAAAAGPLLQQQQQQPGAPVSQQQQQQQQHLPAWAAPGAPTGPGAAGAIKAQQQPAAAGSGATGFGAGYQVAGAVGAAASAVDAARHVGPVAIVRKLRTYGSSWMSADDINYVLRIQHMATHSGLPYVEDFYFQAFLNKYFGSRNAILFAPSKLRELGGELHLEVEPRFADLAGLGKVVLSNIRTPKMLMDVGGSSHGKANEAAKRSQQGGRADEQQQDAGSGRAARPLEQEPMLAARIMAEDCMLLLCDVEDIDRTFAASAAAAAAVAAGMGMPLPPGTPGPISAAQALALLQRRAALLGGIAASFRLPDMPTLPAAGDAVAVNSGDGVFVRILALPKGRSLMSKTLRLMFTPPPTQGTSQAGAGKGAAAMAGSNANSSGSSSSTAVGLDLIWALLRNAQLAFGPAVAGPTVSEAERRLTDSTIGLSSAASEMIKRLTKPEQAVGCLAACVAGLSGPAPEAAAAGSSSSQLLPLYPAGRVAASASPDWLGSILASLLLRASELGLGSFAAEAAAAPARGLGDGPQGEDEELQEQLANGTVSPAVAAEWKTLLGQFTQLVLLHLWQLVQAARGEAAAVAAAAGGGPGSGEVLQACLAKMACVPLVRVLMAHCEADQQEQLRSYLSEVGR